MSRLAVPVVVALCFVPAASAANSAGTFQVPADDTKALIAEGYRFKEAYKGEYKLADRYELRHSDVTVRDLTFPSPMTTDITENNTVHAEYFTPNRPGKFPAVVVLDIMQGNQRIARGEAMWLAQNGVASLVVVLPHYNQRRAPDSKVKLVSTNIPRTLDGIRQGVLDCRCAIAWLASRPEIDADNLGMVGTSLGSFLTALTSANEPRIKNVCMILGGGGLVDAYYEHPKAKDITKALDAIGGKTIVKRIIAPVDPITYSAQLKGKNLLMIAARDDEVVPPKAATALWEATGKQRIVWLDAGHITAGLYTMSVLREIRDHVRAK
ncbi:alpha/beta hydrolase family protein [Gemmata sp. G18]|uniref:Alpha/beta hydrolase family protein n=1 Tax=Gemmata palustris TaxID=2822762 RepID=A0ABS5C3A1_9BACT|nr:alpha/beta hydrolase family protein [Gemmata palustris]MBP3960162.1 alpha/beta hydrolase family protein [Gemmata palustris]